MCLLLSCNTGFLLKEIAATLSTKLSASSLLMSPSNQAGQIPWHAAVVAATYSASYEDNAVFEIAS